MALSDITSNRSEHSPARPHNTSSKNIHKDNNQLNDGVVQHELSDQTSRHSPRPGVIKEVSEPSSPHISYSPHRLPCQSALTKLIQNSPTFEEEDHSTDDEEPIATAGVQPVTVHEGILSQPGESTPLLSQRTAYGTIKDVESQKTHYEAPDSKGLRAVQIVRDRNFDSWNIATNPKSWNKEGFWKIGIRQTAGLLPSVVLGLLLNVLDALSYGRQNVSPMKRLDG